MIFKAIADQAENKIYPNSKLCLGRPRRVKFRGLFYCAF